jgi:hypothetical protein
VARLLANAAMTGLEMQFYDMSELKNTNMFYFKLLSGGCGAHPTSYPVGTGGSFSVGGNGKAPVHLLPKLRIRGTLPTLLTRLRCVVLEHRVIFASILVFLHCFFHFTWR